MTTMPEALYRAQDGTLTGCPVTKGDQLCTYDKDDYRNYDVKRVAETCEHMGLVRFVGDETFVPCTLANRWRKYQPELERERPVTPERHAATPEEHPVVEAKAVKKDHEDEPHDTHKHVKHVKGH